MQLNGLATLRKNLGIPLFRLIWLIFIRQFPKIYWTKHYLGPRIWLTFRTRIFP